MALSPESVTGGAGSSSCERGRRTLELALANRGDPLAEIELALAGDPQFVIGHCLRAGLIVRADDHAARSKLVASLEAIETRCPDRRHPARRHASAARAWLDGDHALAAESYGAIVIDRPFDILALAVAHALDFRLGNRRMLRDRVAQVLPAWDKATPGYASVLALHAFGLEENGDYRRAEKTARRSLAIDPRHPGAIHVIAHVMEMQGRAREGLEFLAATEWAWRETSYSVHLAWHRALFHLDAGDAASALNVYDAQIANIRAPAVSDLADGSALLWRLELIDTLVGERWPLLADRWEMQTLTGLRPFYLAHAMMAFAAARRIKEMQRVFDAMSSTSALPEEALVLSFCKALFAFAHGDYVTCVEHLVRVHYMADQCGGSIAQCDLIDLTFVEAALRARKTSLARALVAERRAQKPGSQLNHNLQRRVG